MCQMSEQLVPDLLDLFLAFGETTLRTMTLKGWLEQRKQGEVVYRITDAGREAFRAPLPDSQKRKT